MPLAAKPDFVDRDVVTDAGDDVLQDAAGRNVEQHVIGDDGRHARLRCQGRQFMEPQRIVRPAAQRQRHVGAVAEALLQPAQVQRADLIRFVGRQNRDQALAKGDEIGPIEPALRLAAALLAQRQEAAEAPIGSTIRRIDEDRGAIVKIEAAPHDQPHAGRAGGLMGANDAGQRIAVDDRKRFDAELGRLIEQLIARAGAPQEREMRGALQLDIAGAGHPKIPCKNQRCEPVAPSSPLPAR